MPVTDTRKAYLAVEPELVALRGAAAVLDLAFAELEASKEGHTTVAQSLVFTARSIEAALDRVEEKLCPDVDDDSHASTSIETKAEAA
jgi:hypothetical protein